MIILTTDRGVKAVHRDQVPAGYAGGQIDDDWRVASGDWGDAVVIEVRPLSLIEFREAGALSGEEQTRRLLQLGLRKVGGQELADPFAVLSWGACHAIASLITSVSIGPLAQRQPATQTAAA
mgnify:CR=1 FL=1